MKTNHTITDKGAPQVQPGCKAVLRRLCGAALLLLLAGCADDPAENILPQTADGETVTVEFSLAPDIFTEVDVKAAGTVDENIISDVWVIQHKSDGSGQLQAPVYIDNLKFSTGSYRAQVKLAAQPSKVYLIANTHKSDLCTAANTKDKATLEKLTIPVKGHTDIASDKGVLMTGIWEGTPSSTVGIVGAVPLSRAVSKVTFDLSAKLPAGARFEIAQIIVNFIPDKVFLFSEQDFSGGYNMWSSTLTDNPGTSLSDSPQKLTFYVPECLAGTSKGVSPGDKFPGTHQWGINLSVVGYYSFAGIYYQEVAFIIYLGENNFNDYNVRRNTHYQVTSVIKGISEIDTRIDRFVSSGRDWVTGFDYTGVGKSWCYLPKMDALVGTMNFNDAKDFCENHFDSSNKWRLPTIDELMLAAVYDHENLWDRREVFWSSTPGNNPGEYYILDMQMNDRWLVYLSSEQPGNVSVFCVHDVERK